MARPNRARGGLLLPLLEFELDVASHLDGVHTDLPAFGVDRVVGVRSKLVDHFVRFVAGHSLLDVSTS
jgi:hypothetical protein